MENQGNNGYIRRGECESVRQSVDGRLLDMHQWLDKLDKRLWALVVGTAGSVLLMSANIILTIVRM